MSLGIIKNSESIFINIWGRFRFGCHVKCIYSLLLRFSKVNILILVFLILLLLILILLYYYWPGLNAYEVSVDSLLMLPVEGHETRRVRSRDRKRGINASRHQPRSTQTPTRRDRVRTGNRAAVHFTIKSVNEMWRFKLKQGNVFVAVKPVKTDMIRSINVYRAVS